MGSFLKKYTVPGMLGLFDEKSVTTNPMDEYTQEQQAALRGLWSLGSTGSGLGINLGEAYGGSLGNYQSTGVENAGLASLMALVSGQNPYMQQAGKTFTDFSNTKFNPDDPSSGFAAFSRQVAKQTGRSNDVLNREAAITGNRFSTSIGRQKADLAQGQSDSLQTELARLYQNAQSMKMAGAQGLAGLAGQQQSLSRDAITLGGLERDLKNQEAQAKYSEYQRQRAEKLSQIDIANSVTKLGMAPITENLGSPFSRFVSAVAPAAGAAIGGVFGGPIGAQAGAGVGQGIAGALQPTQTDYRLTGALSRDKYASYYGGY